MRFAPVPGTKVLFSIWGTRVKDYAAYAEANSGVDGQWRKVEWGGEPVSNGPEHPVTMVLWTEAKAFCRWLTEKEQRAGLISGDQSYRLSTDAEWSVAVGLQEPDVGTPKDKNWKIRGVYPWGTEWPPPSGAGNYADGAAKRRFRSLNKRRFGSLSVIEGYEDGYATTSPVGSFRANRYGLYDMGGNVSQWCEDWYDTRQSSWVSRGGSWMSYAPDCLLSSYRGNYPPGRYYDGGFRVVLAGGSSRQAGALPAPPAKALELASLRLCPFLTPPPLRD
jgi:formylglycine-generating enzyme required for sulfatase activity